MTPPDRLYRYRPLDQATFTRELAALKDAYLWSPHFADMNDPMEAFYELGGLGDGLVDHLLKPAGKSTADMYRMAKEIFDRFCLVSFSSSAVDLPLWAYYGSNFAGMCLEFATDRLFVGDFQTERLIPVTYAEQSLPSIQLYELTSQEAIETRLSRKRIEWQHEKEWRILTGAGGPRHYLDEALVRLYLGPRIEDAQADQICALFKDRPTEILRGRIAGYQLSFETVKPAVPPAQCRRVGAGTLNLEELLYARDEIEAFLAVPLDRLSDKLAAIAAQPNVEAISSCDLSGTREALYVWIEQRLRSDRVAWERRYYDPHLQRVN